MPKGLKKPQVIKHKFVYAWGRYMDSKDYYIQDQLAKAEADNAPLNAIFKRSTGEWATVDSIEDPNLALSLTEYVKYLK